MREVTPPPAPAHKASQQRPPTQRLYDMNYAQPKPKFMPTTTYLVVAITTLISVMGFKSKLVVALCMLVTSMPLRLWGTTLFTSFFVHGDFWHLVGNMVALLSFGEQVEWFLGTRRYLQLIFVSTLGASLATIVPYYLMGKPASSGIGASGGVFGVMAFFLFKFPTARYKGVIFSPIPFLNEIPSIGLILFYMGILFIGVQSQVNGIGSTGHLAHLGGALVGIYYFLMWSKEPSENTRTWAEPGSK